MRIKSKLVILLTLAMLMVTINMNFSKGFLAPSWPMYCKDCTLSSTQEGFIEDDIVSIRLDWIYDGSEGYTFYDLKSPVSANGKVIFGDSQGYLTCLSLEDGSFLWGHNYAGSISSVPAIKDKCVYVTNRTYLNYPKQKLDCLDINTGEIIWTYEGKYISPTSYIPLVIDNKALYHCTNDEDLKVMCFSADDGTIVWENHLHANGSIKLLTTEENYIYVAYKSETFSKYVIECLDKETGKTIRELSINDELRTIAVNGKNLYVSSGGKTYCYDKKSFKKKWILDEFGFNAQPVFVDENMYFLSSKGSGLDAGIYFVIVDTLAGGLKYVKKYKQYLQIGERYFNSSISRGGKYLFFGNPNSYFTCFDKENESFIWSYPDVEYMEDSDGGINFNSPAILESKILASGVNGKVYCFEIIDESQITDIRLNTEHVYLYPNKTFDFDVEMYTDDLEIDPLSHIDATWSVEPESLGIIDDNGLFTAGEESGEGFIRVKFKDFEATAKITIDKEPEKRNVLKFVLGEKVYFYKSAKKEMDCPLTIIDGRTFIDVSIIPNSFFGDSIYIETEDRAMCRLEANNIWFEKDNPVAILNGKPIQIDPHNKNLSPYEINGRLLVPLRFQAESLGCKTKWIADTKEVEVEF